jgi:hypothetical protein
MKTTRIQLKTSVVKLILPSVTGMLHLKLEIASNVATSIQRHSIRVRLGAEDHLALTEALRPLAMAEVPPASITETFHRCLCIRFPAPIAITPVLTSAAEPVTVAA